MVRRVVLAVGGAALLFGAPATASAAPDSAEAVATVRWDAGDGASSIGLIGDSTLSGVRWADEYGGLRRFNFVFDAESCRRTLETSCWSREQYRPRTAVTALEDHAGEWGEVLVMMTGYNDPAGSFADGVEAIVDEAREQGIATVVWLSLRTMGVDYEEPLHLANGSTYRDANRSLYELAAASGGDLQIADWASHSAEHPEWFEADGAHLAPAGVEPLTDFIAAQVDVVLAGGTVTADPAPWEEVREGDDGDLVVEVQEALLAAGVDDVEVVDGVFGPRTGAAVALFQRWAGLPETGVVDDSTAIELGLREVAPVTTTTVAPVTTVTTVRAAGPAPLIAAGRRSDAVAERSAPSSATRSSDAERDPSTGAGIWLAALPVAGAVGLVASRRRRLRSSTSSPSGTYDRDREQVSAVSEST